MTAGGGGARAGGGPAGRRGPAPAAGAGGRCPDWRAGGGAAGPGVRAGRQRGGGVLPAGRGAASRVCAVGARGPARYFGGEESSRGRSSRRSPAAGSPAGSASPTACSLRLAAGDGPEWRGRPGRVQRRRRRRRVEPRRARSRSWRPAGHRRSWPRTRSPCCGPTAWRPAGPAGDQDAGGVRGAAGGRGGQQVRGQGVLAHRLARGLDPRPLAARPPAADLAVSVEFDPPPDRPSPWCSRPRRWPSRCTRPGRERTGLRAGADAGALRRRRGDHQAVAARRAAVRARGRRAGALAARRLAARPPAGRSLTSPTAQSPEEADGRQGRAGSRCCG